ncbi:hypothetical protein ACFPRL_06855 [Pseudoclavibacter helvolus]
MCSNSGSPARCGELTLPCNRARECQHECKRATANHFTRQGRCAQAHPPGGRFRARPPSSACTTRPRAAAS